MVAVYRVTQLSCNAWLQLDKQGQVLAANAASPTHWSVDEPWFVALDGRCARSFNVSFPKRIRAVLPAALFSLEECALEPMSSQSVWLQACTWSRHARGFVVSTDDWIPMKAHIEQVPVLPRGVYPDYLFLPWQLGQLTIAKEGRWCRVRSGKETGYSVSVSSLPLLMQSLEAENFLDSVLVYTDDEFDWTSLSSLPTTVVTDRAPWRIDLLPKLSRCQDTVPWRERLTSVRRLLRESLATSRVALGLWVTLSMLLASALATECFLYSKISVTHQHMDQWLKHHVPVHQRNSWLTVKAHSLQRLASERQTDPTMRLLTSTWSCRPSDAKVWQLQGVSAYPHAVIWRYYVPMAVSWKSLTQEWLPCLKSHGFSLRVQKATEPMKGVLFVMEEEGS